MKKRLIVIGALLVVIIIGATIYLVSRDNPSAPAPSPNPTALPSSAITSTGFEDLKFTLDYPTISSTGELFFATYRNTALGTVKPDGSGFRLITPQSFPFVESASWSTDGSRAVLKLPGERTVLFSGEGKPLKELDTKIDNASWSPDGSRFAYSYGPEQQLQLYDFATGRFQTVGEIKGRKFAWSADGNRLAVIAPSPETSGGRLSLIDLSSNQPLQTALGRAVSMSWSPDSANLLVTETSENGPRLALFDRNTNQSRELNRPGFAEKSVWTSQNEVVIAAPESFPPDYLQDREPVSDRLWRISISSGTIAQLTEFDHEVRAMRLLNDRLIVVTNTRIYDLKIGSS